MISPKQIGIIEEKVKINNKDCKIDIELKKFLQAYENKDKIRYGADYIQLVVLRDLNPVFTPAEIDEFFYKFSQTPDIKYDNNVIGAYISKLIEGSYRKANYEVFILNTHNNPISNLGSHIEVPISIRVIGDMDNSPFYNTSNIKSLEINGSVKDSAISDSKYINNVVLKGNLGDWAFHNSKFIDCVRVEGNIGMTAFANTAFIKNLNMQGYAGAGLLRDAFNVIADVKEANAEYFLNSAKLIRITIGKLIGELFGSEPKNCIIKTPDKETYEKLMKKYDCNENIIELIE